MIAQLQNTQASLSAAKSPKDRWIPWYFVMFFLVITAIDGTMVTLAVRTEPGTVTPRAYEKGLSYNDIIEKSALQETMQIMQKALYQNGILSWDLAAQGKPLGGAKIKAVFVRQTHDGYDFTLNLIENPKGHYSIKPEFKLPGIWSVKLEAQWQDQQRRPQQYNTTLDLIAQ